MLKIDKLSASYGYVKALKEVSIEAEKGQIVSIIGSNGAGKTTLLRCLSGLVKPTSGTIEFLGAPVPKKPNEVVKKGIIHVPEGRKTFSGLTIQDNLLVGGYLFGKKENEIELEKNYELFPILRERKEQYAGTLSGGEQQMLAIGRGLMSHPKLILLDEPSLGLAPLIVNQVYELIDKIRDRGITVLLVEQNAKKALRLCDKAYVLENGMISIEGTGDELLKSEAVKKAYLGG
jgi:branched-chain amino acid transport system ATP-binding protein